MQTGSPFLTVEEVAAILRVLPSSVRRYVRSHVLPGRRVRGKILVRRVDLAKLVDVPLAELQETTRPREPDDVVDAAADTFTPEDDDE
jgi:excisionase family DNA binding protein